MKLRFTRLAAANIVEITDYIREHNPAAAQRVRVAIYESLQNLILFPHIGRRQKTAGVRNSSRADMLILCITPWTSRRKRL
jgi:toxin ParE1/3/4